METYQKYIKDLQDDAERVEPVLNYIRGVVYNYPPNKYPEPIPHEFIDFKTTYFSGIEWFFLWDGRPIVISVFRATPEWIVDHVLYPLRARYGCFYHMDVWKDVQKIVYKTEIMGVKVVIQLIDAVGCQWKKTGTKDVYTLDCAA